MSFFEEYEEKVAEEKEADMDQKASDEQETAIVKEETKIRKPFQIWKVEDEIYRLKLGTSEICELEQRYKTNLINLMEGKDGGIPSLTDMIIITHAAMKKYQHGVRLKNVEALFEKYMEAGGSQLEFYTSVYMGIFAASGFFSSSVTENLTDAIENMEERIGQ